MSQLEQQVARMSVAERACGLYLAHVIAMGLAEAYRASASSAKERAELEALHIDPLPEGVTWEALYRLARSNSVEALAWRGAKVRAAEMPETLRARWVADADATLWRRLQFDVERERVVAAAERAGLSLLPLKGVLMADYYPEPGLRSMADIDILYGWVETIPQGEVGYPGFRLQGRDEQAREEAAYEGTREMTRIMEGLGYKAAHVGTANHDSYEKAPCFNFEMHRKLMGPSNVGDATANWLTYYENPWQRAHQDTDDPQLFHFSNEDEYLFHIAHAFKHFDASGCGIRCAVDEAVFLRAKGAGMDWDYVAGELETLGMTEFEGSLRRAACAAFPAGEGEVPDAALMGVAENDRTLLLYLLGCGVYGNMQTRVERQVEKSSGKRAYILERLCPDEATLADYHPFFYRHRALLPVLVVVRLVKAATIKLPRTLRELKVLARR